MICCVFTLTIPLLYIFRQRHSNYGRINQHEYNTMQDIEVPEPS